MTFTATLPQHSPTPHFPGHRFLHSPGPTHLPEAVQNAMRRQPMDLGDPRVDALIAACEQGLRRVLHTECADVFMYATNGHGAWEAVAANLAGPGNTVLVPGTGHFSESWAVLTQALGGTVVRTDYVEGSTMDLGAVNAILLADSAHLIKAIFAVHTDTASGTTHDVQALRQVMDNCGHPALLVVDVVASLGAIPFHMDALRADVVMGASQKGLMSPPGLGFCAVNARAFAQAALNPNPRFYWDWRLRQQPSSYRKFCGTPPLNLLMGLEAALGLIFQEGLPQIWARHQLLAQATQAAVAAWARGGALGFFCKEPVARSASVTAVGVNPHSSPAIEPDRLREVAREQFQVAIAGGLGPFNGRVFRIGHLGDLNPAMLLGCLGAVEAALHHLGVPLGVDSGVQAALKVIAAPAYPA